MKAYLLTFESLTPLMLSERQTTQVTRSRDYISGTTLMGGMAKSYLRMHGLAPDAPDADFTQFFLQDLIRFGNLYPANFSCSLPIEEAVKPLPYSARSCKRWEGFKSQADESENDEHHGVVDHLLLWALFKKSSNLKIFEQNRYCRACHTKGITERLAPFHGYYQRYGAGQYERSSLNRRLITGTGINRRTGTVQEEILFNYEVLAELTADHKPQQFQGMVHLDDTVAQQFFDFLHDEAFDLRVGRARSRGFGSLRLSSCKPANMTTEDHFKRRLTDFDDSLKKSAEKFKVRLEPDFYFAITCCSDLILRTPDLRYYTCLETGVLAEELDLEDADNLELVYQHASTEKISGWNALWRLPKPVELAISKGSVFLFAYSGDAREDLIAKLYTLEQQGIGSRKSEGFDWVSVSDHFHQEETQL